MSSDTMSITDVKNRLSRSYLERELNSLDRQRSSEMRSSNNELKKFKNKYSKLDLLVEGKVNYGSDVRMYDTHYPGFCYRRNGEYRIPVAQNTTPVMNFEDLHKLLFTDGEVDVEKILCLHLLAVHKSESVLSPPRENISKYRDNSPVERLIERSKKKKTEDSITKLLPTYVLEVEPTDSASGKPKSERTLIRDGRLAARLFINEKIVQLIETALVALQQSNPQKFEELLAMASNPDVLKQIFDKPHIQDFLESLKSQMLISSCESFRLSPPFKAKFSSLSVKTVKGGLENLIKLIRRNVLQTPQSTWVEKLQRSQLEGSSKDAANRSSKSDSPKTESDQSRRTSNKFAKKDFISKNKEALSKVKKLDYDDDKKDTARSRRRSTVNEEERLLSSGSFHASDFKASSRKKSFNDDDYEIGIANAFEDHTLNPEILAQMIRNKVESAYQKDLSATQNAYLAAAAEQQEETPSATEEDEKENPRKGSLQKSKYPYIKKTTCEACMGKWKRPLPSPKTPLIKRNLVPVLDQDTYKEVATESTHRISQIIDKEYSKLRVRENSRSGSMSSSKSSRNSARESFLKKYFLDTVELNEMDLARIKQEIKEKETQKKLDEFLQE